MRQLESGLDDAWKAAWKPDQLSHLKNGFQRMMHSVMGSSAVRVYHLESEPGTMRRRRSVTRLTDGWARVEDGKWRMDEQSAQRRARDVLEGTDKGRERRWNGVEEGDTVTV
ncbi:hypothetical protein G7046_g7358 [Stylonectria norvegica]|nr:hypothetical protein G7046_g7358 [Stylonectria norvegica]